MSQIRIRTLSGGEHRLDEADLLALSGGIRGKILTGADSGYDAARSIWNGMIAGSREQSSVASGPPTSPPA